MHRSPCTILGHTGPYWDGSSAMHRFPWAILGSSLQLGHTGMRVVQCTGLPGPYWGGSSAMHRSPSTILGSLLQLGHTGMGGVQSMGPPGPYWAILGWGSVPRTALLGATGLHWAATPQPPPARGVPGAPLSPYLAPPRGSPLRWQVTTAVECLGPRARSSRVLQPAGSPGRAPTTCSPFLALILPAGPTPGTVTPRVAPRPPTSVPARVTHTRRTLAGGWGGVLTGASAAGR